MARRKLLVADLLCGAGGSSTGCQRALRELGLEMELVCVNHWPTAIETHTLNHPEARHYVQDIATVRPHLLVPEGYLDLLMASPTCTHHSVARGGKPTSDQQRSDPWHIITWLTELRVKNIIIENVWEFIGWGPVDWRTGKPIKSRKGEYFNAWIDTLRRLQFEPEWRKLNAANYGDATTRQRFILKASSVRKTVGWAPITHVKRPDADVALGPGLKPWRAAREIIDWRRKGRSIYGRAKPLAFKTLSRTYAGAVKHGWPVGFLIRLRNHMAEVYPNEVLPPLPAGAAEGAGEACLVVLRNNMATQDLADPAPTIAANGQHIGLAEPVIVRTNMHGRKSPGVRSGEDPLMTITTDGGIAVAQPLLLSQHNSGSARTADEPLPTITTGGAGCETRPGCARPMLVEPFVLSQASGGAPRATSQPLPTIVTGGQRGSGTALISPYYGSGSGETCTTAEEPLPTVTSKARFGMVVPVTHSQGGNSARDLADPLPTVTTAKGGEFALVLPVTHAGAEDRSRNPDSDPLPTVTGANRGELAFITAQHGEREGQAPRTHSLDNPTPTIAATGHVDLVEGVEQYDILFRMLEPDELAAAMGFTDEDQAYEFAGTKTEQIKQIGNAVSVAMMKAEVKATFADLARATGRSGMEVAA